MTDDYLLIKPTYPTFPCICGHLYSAHGTETETHSRWDWDDYHKEEVETSEQESVPFCYECEEGCYFIEMTNLEFLEWKSNGNDKR